MTKLRAQDLLKEVVYIPLKALRRNSREEGGRKVNQHSGRGMTFVGIRPYQYGDDIRHIDWKVTARLGETYIKIYKEEQRRTVYVICDVSASMYTGTQQSMAKIAINMASSLCYSALREGFQVSLLGFDKDVKISLDPSDKEVRTYELVQALASWNSRPANQTNLANALNQCYKICRSSSVVFLISDFLDQQYDNSLLALRKKCKLYTIKMKASEHKLLAKKGLFRIKDAESQQEKWIDSREMSNFRPDRSSYLFDATQHCDIGANDDWESKVNNMINKYGG